ncbi:MAG: non-hydrolyzing UDP-N-acetylglucosamine 2-epimerase [bacterium]
MRLLTVVGARPQFVKAAVLSRAIAAHGAGLTEVLVHTGQHHDTQMSDVFFHELGLPVPTHHLGVAGGTHGEMTARMLERLEPVLAAEAPDWVIVHGDTNSTLAGALAAAKLRLPLAHVEAGLRSFDRGMPEEVNRILTDHCSDLLFAPTVTAVENLRQEGLRGARVRLVGDVMHDSALWHGAHARPTPALAELLATLRDGFLVATVHRAGNTDDPARLAAILGALGDIAASRPVVLPLHPRTRTRLAGWTPPAGLHVIEPVGYLDMVAMLAACAGVLTDSGGLQKEAYFAGRRCLVLREATEWVELVDGGYARLVGADRERIVREAASFLQGGLDGVRDLYGDGRAGERIVAALVQSSGANARSH